MSQLFAINEMTERVENMSDDVKDGMNATTNGDMKAATKGALKPARDCNDLAEIRAAIDIIDNKIVELVANRSSYVKEVAKFKLSVDDVADPKRVQFVIDSKKELAQRYGAPPTLVESIYEMMLDFFLEEEVKVWKSK